MDQTLGLSSKSFWTSEQTKEQPRKIKGRWWRKAMRWKWEDRAFTRRLQDSCLVYHFWFWKGNFSKLLKVWNVDSKELVGKEEVSRVGKWEEVRWKQRGEEWQGVGEHGGGAGWATGQRYALRVGLGEDMEQEGSPARSWKLLWNCVSQL